MSDTNTPTKGTTVPSVTTSGAPKPNYASTGGATVTPIKSATTTAAAKTATPSHSAPGTSSASGIKLVGGKAASAGAKPKKKSTTKKKASAAKKKPAAAKSTTAPAPKAAAATKLKTKTKTKTAKTTKTAAKSSTSKFSARSSAAGTKTSAASSTKKSGAFGGKPFGASALKGGFFGTGGSSNFKPEQFMQFGKEGIDQFSKSTDAAARGFNEAVAQGRETVEACIECGNITGDVTKAFTNEMFRFANDSFSDTVEISKDLLNCRTMNDVIEVQNKLARSHMDHFFNQSAKFSEMMFQYMSDASEPFNERIAEAAERITKATKF